ncbi:lipid droplet-associated protein [Actinoalloteichus sp. GBA129-24]|uniref:lipid droplet-associated protein n=1 Tax=Actinoalloteichus sp. GBA129-24 TaxID=1612551 RepID=UPI0009507C0E|nr:lipid droplet-associated protein [Actinoalloteichus sp. GBA129-24]APU18886.1 hypothetical protein UA75_04275 [Actinoalloteichus sp. GBA129-24]
MTNLPLPVRLAAGLAVTAVEQARRLPEQLAGLPVTVVSQALALSMRVQQQVTELAIKGDEALSGLRTPEENPEWATFDEDLPADDVPSAFRAGSPRPDTDDHDADDAGLGESALSDPVLGDVRAGRDARSGRASTRSSAAATGSSRDAGSDGDADADRPGSQRSDSAGGRFAGAVVPEEDSPHPSDAPVTGYDAFSLAQLRGRLRGFSPEQLRALLAYEQAGEARPAYVRMLSNRLVTVGAE